MRGRDSRTTLHDVRHLGDIWEYATVVVRNLGLGVSGVTASIIPSNRHTEIAGGLPLIPDSYPDLSFPAPRPAPRENGKTTPDFP